MAVSIGSEQVLQPGSAKPVFDTRAGGMTSVILGYDVARDGRFLLNLLEPSSEPSEIKVVVNWPALVGKD